jgi:uncharacterized membrane protein
LSDASRPETEPRPGGSRRLKYALIASLALNLLVIGAVAGTMIGFGKHHGPRGGHPRGEDFGLMGLTRTLPEERRKEIRKQLREERGRLRPLFEDVRTARREAADKLAAEPFDRAALESALAAVGERERTLRQEAVNIFVGHVERLTPDERGRLAEWWRKKSQPLPQRKSRKKDETDSDAK